MQARNLKSKDINGLSDPYVKVWLLFGEKRVEKKKTPIYKCNLNPTFNQVYLDLFSTQFLFQSVTFLDF